jgi:hypothetical protein
VILTMVIARHDGCGGRVEQFVNFDDGVRSEIFITHDNDTVDGVDNCGILTVRSWILSHDNDT